jgi:hypothetical protein
MKAALPPVSATTRAFLILRRMLKLTLTKDTIKNINPKTSHSPRFIGKINVLNMLRIVAAHDDSSIVGAEREFCKELRDFPVAPVKNNFLILSQSN